VCFCGDAGVFRCLQGLLGLISVMVRRRNGGRSPYYVGWDSICNECRLSCCLPILHCPLPANEQPKVAWISCWSVCFWWVTHCILVDAWGNSRAVPRAMEARVAHVDSV
jgi:hypothetical protein